MQVLKFGGSSVANASNISKVVAIVQKALQNNKVALIVSALGGVTDGLLQTAALAAAGNEQYKQPLKEIENRHLEVIKELIPIAHQSSVLSLIKKCCNEIEDICNGIFLLEELSARIKDRVISYGELMSSQIISAAFQSLKINAEWKDARQLIVTDANFGNAVVNTSTSYQNIKKSLATEANLYVFPGFVAATKEGLTTTLGRGGSDYTAAIVAAAIDASSLEIWTDVSGMMTADPRVVSHAKVIPNISYQEAMELSHFGAKVIYPPTIQPVMNKSIPTWVKNTFAPEDAGTVIENAVSKNGSTIRGISSINKVALLSLEGTGMVGIPGFSKRLFEALALAGINVILITQGSSEHSICVGIEEAFAQTAKAAVNDTFSYEIETGKVEPLVVELGLSIVALVGDNMKNHPGSSGKMFGAMGRNGVNVRAIAQGASERNISAVVAAKDVKKTINILHEAFFETTYRQINLSIIGLGNVGSRLMAQLQQQQQYLQDQLRLQVRVVGIANSKKMLFNEEGIDLSHWKEAIQKGDAMQLDNFVATLCAKNLRNSVLVDVTANEAVANTYASLLQKSISVVACNKIACSAPYLQYKKLKDLARTFNSQFLFETNVGAGLPIIGSLNDLVRSGDVVHSMQAVLSGTLNFVFNHYNGQKPFAEVVKQAQEEGYTEPDPRLDLSGTDVMRKIMILAREAGATLEMDQITNHSFMPASCMQGTVADFYTAMAKEEAHFKALYDKATAEGCKLKFVAAYDGRTASVGLQHINPQHDLYQLYGKDNVVLFYTNRYVEQPMVIKGAGAGAEVTASGVFADIIRAAQQ
jgi:bifunctional aspartokinase / homoserine dehydrogenase 1